MVSGADVVGGTVVVGAAVVGAAVVDGWVVGEVDGLGDELSTDELGVTVVSLGAEPVGLGVGVLTVDDWVIVTEASVDGGVVATVGAGESGGATLDPVVDPFVVGGAVGVCRDVNPTIVPSRLKSTEVAEPVRLKSSAGKISLDPTAMTRLAPVPMVTNTTEKPARPARPAAIRARFAGWTLFSTMIVAGRQLI